MEGLQYTFMLVLFAETLAGVALWLIACIAAGLVGATAGAMAFLFTERALGTDYRFRSGGPAPVRARKLVRGSGNRCVLSLPIAIAGSAGVSLSALYYLTGAVGAWLDWAVHH